MKIIKCILPYNAACDTWQILYSELNNLINDFDSRVSIMKEDLSFETSTPMHKMACEELVCG